MPRLLLARLMGVMLVYSGAVGTPASAQAQATDPSDEREVAARTHFERGVAHSDRGEWQAALAEFLRSRELVENKANTKNAAICSRKAERYDEALQLFERVLTFADLAANERVIIEREIAELNDSVGTLELRSVPDGAALSIDGTARVMRSSPLPQILRLSAGVHQLRVTREGSLPFERRLELAGGRTLTIDVALAPLTRAGRLRVRARDQAALRLLIDGAVVGDTPWEGALAPGQYTLQTIGPGTTGTPPQRVTVALDELREVELVASELAGPLRVSVQPPAAELSIDDIPVGRHRFDGRMPAGLHQVTARLAGFRTISYAARVERSATCSIQLRLDRDEPVAPQLSLEASFGLATGLSWGGDLRASCHGSCSARLPLGGAAWLRAHYVTGAGFGAGLHVGYLGMQAVLTQRAVSLEPVGLAAHTGTVDDHVALRGLLVGTEAEYSFRSRWSVVLRLALGMLLGSSNDRRNGNFRDSTAEHYEVTRNARASATYLYVGPELHIERAIAGGLSVHVGLQLLMLTALHAPTWRAEDNPVLVGRDGLGYFDSETTSGRFMLVATPLLGLRYHF